MKRTFAIWLLLTLAVCGLLRGQSPPEVKTQITLPPDYKTQILLYRDTTNGKVLNVLLSGDERTQLADRDDLITPFQMKSFRNGAANEVQLIGQAPECHIDSADGRAWDKGPVVLFTPNTNVWVRGDGFFFSQTNHFLDISNNVETRVLRALLKTSMLSGGQSNAPAKPGQIMKIFSDRCHFDYESNFAQYFGHVHVIDPQLDLTSERLFIQMTTNSAIKTILALDNVVMTTTNKGYATGPRAFYYVTNGPDASTNRYEMTEMTGGAIWHNGDEQARAEKFIYDSTRHFLTAIGDVRVWWPNGPQPPGAAPKADATGYRELWADFATLQWPPTNGPVETMHATGHVIIVNQADKSRSTGEQADYSRTNDLFALAGNPDWWNDQMDIKGRTLTAEATNKVYHARGNSHLKLKVTGTGHTNQWLYIDSETLDYQTNMAIFHDHVKARLFDNDELRDTLTSDQLDVELVSNEVKTAIARGDVHGHTAPDKFGRTKTIACDKLTAHRSPVTKLMIDVMAENHVVLEQFGTNIGEPRDRLTAAIATAYFSPVTNQVIRAVAEHHVVIDQFKTNQTTHATGEKVVYRVPADEVKLTGAPEARTDKYIIADSDYIIWQPKTNRFQAFGQYHTFPAQTAITSVPEP